MHKCYARITSQNRELNKQAKLTKFKIKTVAILTNGTKQGRLFSLKYMLILLI